MISSLHNDQLFIVCPAQAELCCSIDYIDSFAPNFSEVHKSSCLARGMHLHIVKAPIVFVYPTVLICSSIRNGIYLRREIENMKWTKEVDDATT